MVYKLPIRTENSNKSTYGKVLNVAGSDYMPGAGYLSSVSALKVGCGYCFLCSTERVISAVANQTQNVVFLPYKELLKHLQSADVVEIGCGLSQNKDAIKTFELVIDNINLETPLVIDADGINILSKNPTFFISKNLKNIVLTPHPKEASRLLNCSLENILSDIEASAKKISEIYNCITVLKTHNTIITTPKLEVFTNTSGNNSMAKAGSGDVLTGIISGLIAQKLDLLEAVKTGVYLHGLCGDIAREALTNYSVMASDLIEYIPMAIKYLLDNK